MMQKQTLEFNIGFIFSKIERDFFKHTKESSDTFHSAVQVPKVWFGLPCSKWDSVDISLSDKAQIEQKLYDISDSIFSGWEVRFYIKPINQYIEINYVFLKKEKPKKMTVGEIEKALGYKIEIISGD